MAARKKAAQGVSSVQAFIGKVVPKRMATAFNKLEKAHALMSEAQQEIFSVGLEASAIADAGKKPPSEVKGRKKASEAQIVASAHEQLSAAATPRPRRKKGPDLSGLSGFAAFTSPGGSA